MSEGGGREGDPLEESLLLAVTESFEAGLFQEFCRLHGHRMPSSPIEQMVDRASGYEETVHREFVSFVRKYVWEPWLIGMLKNNP